jgi:hypothetical protein
MYLIPAAAGEKYATPVREEDTLTPFGQVSLSQIFDTLLLVGSFYCLFVSSIYKREEVALALLHSARKFANALSINTLLSLLQWTNVAYCLCGIPVLEKDGIAARACFFLVFIVVFTCLFKCSLNIYYMWYVFIMATCSCSHRLRVMAMSNLRAFVYESLRCRDFWFLMKVVTFIRVGSKMSLSSPFSGKCLDCVMCELYTYTCMISFANHFNFITRPRKSNSLLWNFDVDVGNGKTVRVKLTAKRYEPINKIFNRLQVKLDAVMCKHMLISCCDRETFTLNGKPVSKFDNSCLCDFARVWKWGYYSPVWLVGERYDIVLQRKIRPTMKNMIFAIADFADLFGHSEVMPTSSDHPASTRCVL